MSSKICCTCKQEKPLFDFPSINSNTTSYRSLGTKTGQYEGRCRPCKAEYAREWRKKHKNYKGSGKLLSVPVEDALLMSAISERLNNARLRIKKFGGIPSDLNRDYLYRLFKEQNGVCALSGVPMKVEKRAVSCLSLDQICAGKGYVVGNVQWVAWAANRAKGDMDSDVFLDMCHKIVEYQKVQRLSPRGSTP